ncbi:hypothetical protein FNV43_RR14567 [Rhamnella rubrinervis]|uniref:TCP domain-containing protein n=1 Tax=Rhamnella rubrinervis TaxID=2594499 RepID=A0A8K0MFV5_9ROSA|nr:hypothetical protein FNV43_RR14567 [Rhamnella rubrinervis]
MITSTSTKEGDLPSRQEGNSSDQHGKVTNKASSSSSTPWLRLKDPRIVRVSRAFGGKDRHSKVCTIRGLRDRRVRLSVPTAIQLYDLQDRLGLNQPSKVVDWLLNAAKHEIDELPPLPMPTGNFVLNHQSAGDHTQSNEEEGFKNFVGWDGGSSRLLPRSNFWSSDALWRARSKEVARETATDDDHKDKQQGNDSNNILPRGNTNYHPAPAFLPGLLNNVTPYGYHHWETSSNYLGNHGLITSQADHHLHNLNVVSVPSTLSLSTGTPMSQFLVCPQPGITQHYFPSNGAASGEIDHARQVNHFQMLSSTTTSSSTDTTSQNLLPITSLYPNCQSMRPFHFSMNSKLGHSTNNIAGSQPNKAREFSSK